MLTCHGISMATSGFLIPQLEDPLLGFGITTDEGSWIASITVFGSISGSLLGGLQCGKLGRRKSLLIDCHLFMLGTFLMAISQGLSLLLAGRFIVGHAASSAVVAAPIFTSEISQPKVRKYTALFPLACVYVGIAVAYIFGALLPWRTAILITFVVPAISFVLLFASPESATWLISQSKEDEAKLALTRLRGEDNMDIVVEEFQRILANKVLSEEESPKLKDLLVDPTFVKPIGFLLAFYTIGIQLCGSPIISFYKVPLLLEADIQMDPYIAAAWLAAYRGVLTILALPFVGRFHKRTTLFCCGCLLSAGLLLLSSFTYFFVHEVDNYPEVKWIPIISILLIYTSHSFGWESSIFSFRGELLPAKGRSLGSSIIGFVSYLVAFTVIKLVPKTFEMLGVHGTFMISTGFVICELVLSFFCMPDTSELTLEAIEDMYRPRIDENQE